MNGGKNEQLRKFFVCFCELYCTRTDFVSTGLTAYQRKTIADAELARSANKTPGIVDWTVIVASSTTLTLPFDMQGGTDKKTAA